MTRDGSKGRRLSLLWVVLPILILTAQSHAQETTQDRRASIIYNLSKFVSWPPASDRGSEEIFTLCLLGEDTIAPELRRMCKEGEEKDHSKFRRIGEPEAAIGCHLLVVGAEQAPGVPELIKRLNRHPVFTVSDMPGFARMGGMVEIVSATNRVSFQINLDAAKRAGLIIKAPLLQIARVIQGGG